MLYCKIPITSPGVVFVQKAFSVGLFSKSGLSEEMLYVKNILGFVFERDLAYEKHYIRISIAHGKTH